MTEAEFLLVIGTLSGSFLVGYGVGFVIRVLNQFVEKI